MKRITLHVYNDPGHAWGKISIKKLHELNIAHLISYYSYMRKGYVYLEEDCDLSTLINALKSNNIAYDFKHHYADKSSKIRNYDCYSIGGAL